MKTSTKTLAFFVAAVAVTACTNQTIEPVSPMKQPQFIIAQPDSLISVDYNGNEYITGATRLDEPNATPKPHKPAVGPAAPAVPQPVIMPIALEPQDIY